MLLQPYELPAAFLLVLGGALTCFAGYRLFRFVLAIYGFALGAILAAWIVGVANTPGVIVGVLVGGLIGAVVLVLAYLVGIALVGASLGVFAVHVSWHQFSRFDPPSGIIILLSLIGALAAMVLQRYVIIAGTAFGGAWTVLVGALALAADRSATRIGLSSGGWIVYPFAPARGQPWIPLVWTVLGMLGTIVQLAVTGRRR